MAIVNPKVEIEFTAGVWTDVTADVDLSAQIVIRYGRVSELTAPSVATCTFQLDNHLGKYTPAMQLLTDGVTAHPYYPNVLPRKRVRVSNPSGVRFLGYIKSFPPQLENGVRGYVTITANDRQDQISKVTSLAAHIETMRADSPVRLFPMTDPAGSVGAYDIVTNGRQPPTKVAISGGTPGTFAFGITTNLPPLPDGTTCAKTNSSVFKGSVAPGVMSATNWAVSSWASKAIGAAGSVEAFGIFAPDGSTQLEFGDARSGGGTAAGGYYFDQTNSTTSITFPGAPDDGLMHHYAITGTDNGTHLIVKWYLDGALSGTLTLNPAGNTYNAAGADLLPGSIIAADRFYGPAAMYAYTLTAAQVLLHAQIGNGTPTLTTGQRVAEYYAWAGVAVVDMNVDAGQSNVSSHPTSGKDVVSLIGEMAETEGGAAAGYITPTGVARFADRTFRKPGAPTITLDAVKDLTLDSFMPSFDDLGLITTSTVTINSGATQFYTDAAAAAIFGPTGDTATSYTSDMTDGLHLAEDHVAGRSQPALRLPQFAFDLQTAETAGLAAAWQAVEIGSRARINNLPKGLKAGSRIDLLIEGWTETIGKDVWSVVCDSSPADNPSRMVWDDTTFGRWGIDPGSITLHTSVNATATSLTVDIAANKPGFTLDPTMYPLDIWINEERMTVTAATGASTPQVLTVTRGAAATQAAPQTAGVSLALAPTSTWTL